MRLTVFFTPATILPDKAQQGDIYIVIDVIRATTTLAVMFDRRASRVLVAGSIEQARKNAEKVPRRLLCGERFAKRIPDFDYGNSPSEFSQLDLTGRTMILTTTNGTRAFYACPEGATRMAGCFYNAHAVTSRALALALERSSNISLVCSGEYNYFALDDAVCAGYLALELQRQYAEYLAGYPQGKPLFSHESVSAAIALYNAFTPPILIDHCASAQTVLEAGLLEDPPFCMRIDGSISIPIVAGTDKETGLLAIERM